MTIISDKAVKEQFGITHRNERMGNNELRFRLNSIDGSAYIRTVAGDIGAWQNSHFHKYLKETYVIQKGWMAFASLIDSELSIVICSEGEVISTEPLVVHNVYLSAGTVLHTVKHGVAKDNDWFKDEELDNKTKTLTEMDITKPTKDPV